MLQMEFDRKVCLNCIKGKSVVHIGKKGHSQGKQNGNL